MVLRLRKKTRLGLTLVEMLATMAVTLILVLALAQVFKIIGDNVADGRAIVELSSSIRDTANRLQDDLEAITVPARPWPEPGSGLGYLEYLEGPGFDLAPVSSNWNPKTPTAAASIVGDCDDVLAFTVRTTGQPFVGQLNGNTIHSHVAEIIWWLELNDRPEGTPAKPNGKWDWDPILNKKETFSLHRRVLLVLPDQVNLPAGQTPLQFYRSNDLSVRFENGRLMANSLSDLTKRQNRVGHVPERGAGPQSVSFPYLMVPAMMPQKGIVNGKSLMPRQTGAYFGEDVILSNVIGFDVRVFDPEAPIKAIAGGAESVGPGDPAFNPAAAVRSYGAFVDLGFARYRPTVTSTFSGPVHPRSQLSQTVYDTWSLDYEFDGFDQDKDTTNDEGTDGFDNDGNFGVDDVGERETSPPYPSPLRGIQIIIRVLDPDSRQIRQLTVSRDFTPE